MKRYIISSVFFLAMTSMASFTASAGTKKSSSVTVSDTKQTEPHSASEPLKQAPATKTVPPAAPHEKAHAPKLEELPHIHHYHKERVKKVKRHHKKCWVLSMVLLVLCQVALLVIAYMHITPH